MRRGSLESRLCFLVAGLLFALLLAVGHVQMTGQKSALIEEKTDRYQSLSNALALTYRSVAVKEDQHVYNEFTRQLLKSDKDITYVIISNSSGHVLFADAREKKSEKPTSFVGMETQKLIRFLNKRNTSNSEGFKNISMPTAIGPNKSGKITIGFGSGSMADALEEMQTNLLGTFAAAFLLGMIGAVWLAKAIVGPIKKLIHAARAVASGNLDISVPIPSSDEIGELGDTFNSMVVALRESRDKLIERANTDSLTDLYNHRYFQERLASELSRANRYKRPLSMIMLDIDHFKTLNDTHGHPFGDIVLQQVAKIMVREARDIDIVARYGGEEFSIILPETEVKDAMVVADRLRQGIQHHCFVGSNGQTVPVTISLGVAQYPIHSAEREGLIMAADLAMYQAKSMGRNRVVAYSNEIQNDQNPDPYKLYLLLHATDVSTIEAMAAAVDSKGQRYQGFSKAVMNHCIEIAQELGLPEEEQNNVRIASLLHDIGKLAIPDAVLNKQDHLNEEEHLIIKNHPALGCAIVQKSPHLKSMLPGILYHHERWNGSGYPNCLKGEEIPLIARIVAVADAFHAMLTKRPNGEARSISEAKREISSCAGTQFDPKVVKAFLAVLEREEAQSTEKAA